MLQVLSDEVNRNILLASLSPAPPLWSYVSISTVNLWFIVLSKSQSSSSQASDLDRFIAW